MGRTGGERQAAAVTRRIPRQLTVGQPNPQPPSQILPRTRASRGREGHFVSVALESVAVNRRLHSYPGNHQDLGPLPLARCSADPR